MSQRFLLRFPMTLRLDLLNQHPSASSDRASHRVDFNSSSPCVDRSCIETLAVFRSTLNYPNREHPGPSFGYYATRLTVLRERPIQPLIGSHCWTDTPFEGLNNCRGATRTTCRPFAMIRYSYVQVFSRCDWHTDLRFRSLRQARRRLSHN